MLKSLHYVDGAIAVSRKFETRDDDEFAHIQYDPVSGMVATGSEKGQIDVSCRLGNVSPSLPSLFV